MSNDAPEPTRDTPSALAGLVLSALIGGGYRPADSSTDGYELLSATVRGAQAVMVRPVYNGKLRDYATSSVRRTWIARYTRALQKAGLHTQFVDVGGVPVGVVAARDVESAAQAAIDAITRFGRRIGADG